MKERRGLVPREGWEPGPWDDEPDRVEWIDEATGYPCLVIRHFLTGNLCGYVAVPPGHPLHGLAYQDDAVDGLNVHNGITYSSPCQEPPAAELSHIIEMGCPPELLICHKPEPGQPDDVWWFGFHCAGWRDIQPGMDASLRRTIGRAPGDLADRLAGPDDPFRRRYWPVGYVQAECRSLAAQLAGRAA